MFSLLLYCCFIIFYLEPCYRFWLLFLERNEGRHKIMKEILSETQKTSSYVSLLLLTVKIRSWLLYSNCKVGP
ncbi:hypothetical protein VNO80_14768 [Phaseolus coccineus]|uniref:Uncharacterized protein n=1 Tax=Phaseolus coccineus TaxID=3886 RepID=A0AAN9MKC2_PHACN